MLKKILDGVSAGLMIIIGCSVFLACESKIVGAVMFAVALITICFKGQSLFTGKVGFIVESHKKEDFSVLLLGLLGNAIGTILFGLLVYIALPNLQVVAEILLYAKLEQTFIQTFIRAIFCGVLMYVAVSVFKENKSIAGIIFCVPVFILSGFEHSIADMGYFAISGVVSLEAFTFILTVILGNAIGGMLIPLLSGKLVANKKETLTNDEEKSNEEIG